MRPFISRPLWQESDCAGQPTDRIRKRPARHPARDAPTIAIEIRDRPYRLPVDLHDDEAAPHRRHEGRARGVDAHHDDALHRGRDLEAPGKQPDRTRERSGRAACPRATALPRRCAGSRVRSPVVVARTLRQLHLRRLRAGRRAAVPAGRAIPAGGRKCRESALRWSRTSRPSTLRMMS